MEIESYNCDWEEVSFPVSFVIINPTQYHV